MLAQMLDLMRLMESAIRSDELTAEGLMHDADLMQACYPGAAGVLRTVARNHRVKAIEMQARLGAVRQEYVRRFREEPEAGA